MPTHRHLGDIELLVLSALMRLEDAYGVSISREIERQGKRLLALGSVYAALERLESKGLVESAMGAATPERGGRAKRHFRITGAGLRELRTARRALLRMWQGVPLLQGGRA